MLITFILFIHMILIGWPGQQYRLTRSHSSNIWWLYVCMEAPDPCIICKSLSKDQFWQLNYFVNLCLLKLYDDNIASRQLCTWYIFHTCTTFQLFPSFQGHDFSKSHLHDYVDFYDQAHANTNMYKSRYKNGLLLVV